MNLQKVWRSFYRTIWGGGKQIILPNTVGVYSVIAGPGRGIRVRVNPAVGGLRWLLGRYEPPLMWFLRKAITPGAVACDIGSQNGLVALIMAKLVGPNGRVYAFEPIPEYCREMETNFGLNPQLTNRITILPYFVGSRHDLSKCQCTLDELYETGRILLPDVVKMDIEGGEADALQGMERIARHRVPQTFVECHLGPEVEGAVLDFFERHHVPVRRSKPSVFEISREGFNSWVFTDPVRYVLKG